MNQRQNDIMLGLAIIAFASGRGILHGADLYGADLYGADLTCADLTCADLTRANLYGADLTRADLTRANLTDADLTRANLTRANLTDADLAHADLAHANLYGANLYGAKSDKTTRWPGFQIPQEGALIVYKKLSRGVLAKLQVPAKAGRTASVVGRKCRAEYVKVLALEGTELGEGRSSHNPAVIYRPGKTVRPDHYDPNPLVECSHGIHFFLTREEAEAY